MVSCTIVSSMDGIGWHHTSMSGIGWHHTSMSGIGWQRALRGHVKRTCREHHTGMRMRDALLGDGARWG